MTSQECHFSSLALQRSRENEALSTLNRQGHASTWPQEESSPGPPKSTVPPLIQGLWRSIPSVSTLQHDDISLDKLQVQQGFSHIQGELCCLAMLRAICRTVVPSSVAHLFSSDLPGVAFLPHPLAGMLNADETILDPSSSTYFRAINLASQKHLRNLAFRSGRQLTKKLSKVVNYCQMTKKEQEGGGRNQRFDRKHLLLSGQI